MVSIQYWPGYIASSEKRKAGTVFWGMQKTKSAFSSFGEFINWHNHGPHGSLNFQGLETPETTFRQKMPLEAYFGMVIDCSDYDGYMNKLDYIKRGRAQNNFRTPQANIYANNGIYLLDF